jgi:hypothetical protein
MTELITTLRTKAKYIRTIATIKPDDYEALRRIRDIASDLDNAAREIEHLNRMLVSYKLQLKRGY